MQLVAVYTTMDDRDSARRLARELVQRKLAACAQIDEVESFYTWQHELQNEAEWRVMFKTTLASYPDAEAAIRELHPYELPAIYAVALEQVFAPYANWVEEGSSPNSDE